jgi:hypothetical protein
MNCQDVALATPDYLTAELDGKGMERFRAHLADCAACRNEVEGLSETWARLGVLPDELPGPALRRRFYAMLEAETREREAGVATPGIRRFTAWRAPSLWAAAAALVVGFCIGVWTQDRRTAGRDVEMALMGTEIDSLRQQVSLALITQSSAGGRLEGVALTRQVKIPDAPLVTGLLDLIDGDPNVNVRLSAVEALYLFSDHPQIRDRLSRSIASQTSPVVQIALIDLAVSVREKRAAAALKDLVSNERVRPEVRQHARSGIEKLL